MKKSNFIALLMGTVSGVMFSLGMCMALLPQWDAFTEGVVLGSVGLVMGLITLFVWFKAENKKLPKMNVRTFLLTVYAIAAVLVLGFGMCMCLVWSNIIWGTVIGLAGIVMLIAMIPMVKGIK